MKKVRKALHGVDSRIQTPDSLRGVALLRKLDGVKQPIPIESKIKELVFPRRANIRSLLAYAAMLALAVGLFQGLNQLRPGNQVAGILPIDQNIELAGLREGGGSADTYIPGIGGYTPGDPLGGQGQPFVDGGEATRLGQFGDYVLFHRPNPTAPGHTSLAPNTLLLVDASEQYVISQIDLLLMDEIAAFYTNGNILTLVGTAENTTYIQSIDYTWPESPAVPLFLNKQGSLTAQQQFDGVLQVASHRQDLVEHSQNVIVLENSSNQSSSTITLVNLSEGTATQTCVLGACEDIVLGPTQVQISYTVDGQAGGPPQERLATVAISPHNNIFEMTLADTAPVAQY